MASGKRIDSFSKCFELAAPRITRLSVHIRQRSSLATVSSLLSNVELPKLEDMDFDYDNEFHEGLDRYISLPARSADLRSISLTGVQTQPFGQFNLENLTSLYLGAGNHWKFMIMSMATFLPAATSLQELHIVGERGMFRASLDEEWDEVYPITLPALRYVRFDNTAPGFLSCFLRELNAPLLEVVDMITPPHRTHNEEGEVVFVGWVAAMRSIMRNPALSLPAHTLKLRDGDVDYDQEGMYMFALFLMAVFPHITSLETETAIFAIFPVCDTFADGSSSQTPNVWSSVEKLKVHIPFDQDSEEEYGNFVTHLTISLKSLKEKGVMNLEELRLNINQSLQPPLGRVHVEGLRSLVGVLVFEDTLA
ncbi:hypothetical protein FS837_010396 [Tulasnella sp. UAMH 9824]|nr:hypothetical protein FS837_010396 [Tulasnella sp. UAMH 9824]